MSRNTYRFGQFVRTKKKSENRRGTPANPSQLTRPKNPQPEEPVAILSVLAVEPEIEAVELSKATLNPPVIEEPEPTSEQPEDAEESPEPKRRRKSRSQDEAPKAEDTPGDNE